MVESHRTSPRRHRRQIGGFRRRRDVAHPGTAVGRRRDPPGVPEEARKRIRLAFIEDNCLLREGLTTLLQRVSDFEVVATDSSRHATVLAESHPDVALLDLGLGAGDSLEVVRTLRSGHPGLRIIMMDGLPAPADLVEFLTVGVCGFVLRDASLPQLVLTIRSVAAGLEVLPDALVDTLYSGAARVPTGPSRAFDPRTTCLTVREGEVVALVAKGLSNKAISGELEISVHTVKSHLRNVMDKLGVHSRLQVAKYVLENSGRPH